jgi:quercetin dioxygenase-like cupin family protein
MKSDIVHGLTFNEDQQAEQAVRAYVPFYNGTRLHNDQGSSALSRPHHRPS